MFPRHGKNTPPSTEMSSSNASRSSSERSDIVGKRRYRFTKHLSSASLSPVRSRCFSDHRTKKKNSKQNINALDKSISSSTTSLHFEDHNDVQQDFNDSMESLVHIVLKQEWDKLINHTKNYPEDSKVIFVIRDGSTLSSRLALHEACRYKAPLECVKALVSACPESLRCRDSMYRFLPIHFACRYGASEEVVEYLLREYPESITKEDKYGCTPEKIARRSSNPNKECVLELFNNMDFDADDGDEGQKDNSK